MSKKVKFLSILISLTAISTASYSANAMEGIIPRNHPFLSLSNFYRKYKNTNIEIENLKEIYQKHQEALENLKFKEVTDSIAKMNNIRNIENNYLDYYNAFKNLLKAKKNYEENLIKAANLLKSQEIDLEYERENQLENKEKISKYIDKIIKIKCIISDEIKNQNKYITKAFINFFENTETIDNISSYFNKILYEINFNKKSNKTSLISKYGIFKKQIRELIEETLTIIKNNPKEYNIKSNPLKSIFNEPLTEEEAFEKTVESYYTLLNKYEEKLGIIEQSEFFQENIVEEKENLKLKLKNYNNTMEAIVKTYETAIDGNETTIIATCEEKFEELNKSIKTDIEDFSTCNKNLKLKLSEIKSTNEICNLSSEIDVLEYIYKSLKTKKILKNCYENMENLIKNYKDAINKNDEKMIFSCEECFEKLYKSIKPDINSFVPYNKNKDLGISKQETINNIHELIRKINKLKLEYNDLKTIKKDQNIKCENIKLKLKLQSSSENMEATIEIYETAIENNKTKIIANCEKKFEKLYSNIEKDMENFISKKPLVLNLSEKNITSEINKIIQKIKNLKAEYDNLKNKKASDIKKNEDELLKENLEKCYTEMETIFKNYEDAVEENSFNEITSCEKDFEKIYNSIESSMITFAKKNGDSKPYSSKNNIKNKINNIIKKIGILKFSYDGLKINKEKNLRNITKNIKKNITENNDELLKENLEKCCKNMKDLIKNYKDAINKDDKGIIFSCEDCFENLYKSTKQDIDNFTKENENSKLNLSKTNIKSNIYELIDKIKKLKAEYDVLKNPNNASSIDDEEFSQYSNKEFVNEDIPYNFEKKDNAYSKDNDDDEIIIFKRS